MSRHITVRFRATRDGPHYRISLYDELGRYVLTSRFFRLDPFISDAIADYLEKGVLTFFAQQSVQTARAAAQP